jgi:glycyl-tRNA synthetase beta chain
MLVEKNLSLGITDLVSLVVAVVGDQQLQDAWAKRQFEKDMAEKVAKSGGGVVSGGYAVLRREVLPTTCSQVTDFIYDRLGGGLREQGASAQEVDAVLALRPQRLADVAQRLLAVRAFAALPEAPALAAANKRIGNILKKSEGEGATVNPALFVEPAEKNLYAAMQATLPAANAKFDAGDYTASLQALAALRTPVDAFFDGVMVNADDPALRANRLGLLKSLHEAMNRVADLSRLAT